MDGTDILEEDARANVKVRSEWTYRKFAKRSACDSGGRETAYCSFDNNLRTERSMQQPAKCASCCTPRS